MRHSHKVLCGGLLALGMSPLTQAVAQANKAKAEAGTGVPVSSAPQVSAPRIEEIIVTGQKFDRDLQDTPASVAVFTELQMEEKNLLSFNDVLIEAPNVYASGDNRFTIRGIDAFSVTPGGSSGLASVYVDGASLPRELITGGAFSTWDAQQVEVLRGPQSTLQGRNALAGAVVMTSKRPEQAWQMNYRLQAGEYGQQGLAVAFGGGVTDDLAFRFSGEKQNFDGYNENITRDEASDFSEGDTYRVKFLYEPSAVDGLSVMLSYTDSSNEFGPIEVDRPKDNNGINALTQRVVTNNDEQIRFYDLSMTALNVDYDINDHWALASITTYSDFDNGYDWDADYSAETLGTQHWDQTTKTSSQEFRLSFDYDRLTGLMGAYYYNEKIDDLFTGIARFSLERVGFNSALLQAQFGLPAVVADGVIPLYEPFDPALIMREAATEREVTSYALFTDMTFAVNDRWDILLGLRYDRESQENAAQARAELANAHLLPNPADLPAPLDQVIAGVNNFIHGMAANAQGDAPLADTANEAWLPKLGASYHWTNDVTTSFVVQRGYRSGGVGVNAARAEVFMYDPEYTWNYELSLRSVWLEGDLVANANMFYTDWEDQQVNTLLSTSSVDRITENAGRSDVKGFELELTYYLTDSLQVYGGVGQAKTEFIDYTVNIPVGEGASGAQVYESRDLSGRPFQDAPEWTGNIGVTFNEGLGWFANVNANYASSAISYTDPLTVPSDVVALYGADPENEGRVLVNGRVGYAWQQVGVYLNVNNIFDETYVSRVANNRDTLGTPRHVGLTLSGSF